MFGHHLLLDTLALHQKKQITSFLCEEKAYKSQLTRHTKNSPDRSLRYKTASEQSLILGTAMFGSRAHKNVQGRVRVPYPVRVLMRFCWVS